MLAGYRVGLYLQKGNRFELVPLSGGGIDSYSAILFDGAGRTFIGTEQGLMVATRAAEGGGLALRMIAMPAGANGPGAHGVFLEAGAVWFGCGTGLCRLTGE